MNMQNSEQKTQLRGVYRPKFKFYHANPKGTGCAMSLELHPAHDQTDGCIMMTSANQMTIGDRSGPNPVFARFDWENAITVKLDFNDLCMFLQVFRGECESINDERGLYHRSPQAATRIVLRHMMGNPVTGYALELYRTPISGSGETRTHILLTDAEALGLCESISGAMSVITFGIPMIVPHDTTAYRNEVRKMHHA